MKEHDLIQALQRNETGRLEIVESLLGSAADLLGLGTSEFARVFDFCKNLNVNDPDKIYDLLAEPFLVCELAELGFSSFRKLPRWIKKGQRRIHNADLFAIHNSTRFVIEVKTIRVENKPKPKPGQPIGNAAVPSWWHSMFINNATMKIKDKDFRAIRQLENAKFECTADKTMLAFNTRRISAALMDTEGYLAAMSEVRNRYPQIDYMACKDRFGPINVFPPLERPDDI